MSTVDAGASPAERTQRVVSLPCGHQVLVHVNASLLAVSGPVMDHQATCRPVRAPAVPAWFAVGWPSKELSEYSGTRSRATREMIVQERSP